MRILTLSEDTKKDILTNLLKRSPNSYGEYEGRVAAIIDDIKARRDEAVFEYTKKFDGYDLNAENILVTDEEIKAAYDEIDPKLVDIIRKALVNIRDYHAKQKRNSWFDANEKGTILGQKITPLKRVGVYVPGGKAAYPSSVLMNVVPAKVAGVDEIIMTTPPSKDGKIYCGTLVAAKEAGGDKIYTTLFRSWHMRRALTKYTRSAVPRQLLHWLSEQIQFLRWTKLWDRAIFTLPLQRKLFTDRLVLIP